MTERERERPTHKKTVSYFGAQRNRSPMNSEF